MDDHAGASTGSRLARVQDLLTILGGYHMTAAFKGLMALKSGHEGWLRVRPPLVALNDAEIKRLRVQWQAFGLDLARE